MENGRKELTGVLCNLYSIVLLAALPLYTGGSYWRIGDSKYLLFRNISLLCLGVWLVCALAAWGIRLKGRRSGKVSGDSGRFSVVDGFVLAYGGCVLLSALCSPYGRTAWTGYRDWYMGAASQLIFVGIYFFVSRNYDQSGYPLYFGEAALLFVTVLGLLNRLGFDPFGLFEGLSEQSWEYSHMLSTVGNINWLCGYLCVALVVPVARYLDCDNCVRKWILYGVSVTGLVLLCIQGSDSGPVLTAVTVLLCIVAGRRDREYAVRGTALAAGTALGIPVMNYLISLRQSIDRTPYDGGSHRLLAWPWWWAVSLALWVVYALLYRTQEKPESRSAPETQEKPESQGALGRQSEAGSRSAPHTRTMRRRTAVTAALIAAAACAGILVLPAGRSLDDSWGTYRGKLWKIAWEGFAEASPARKLVGVGPDCFAEALDTEVIDEGHWAGAVYANAHNEWLNQLVNLGMLGTACYLGIFAGGLWRYRRQLQGVFVICLYLVHSLVSFQQVLNAPLLFLILGMCENARRRTE